jgi:hypothetical protein
VKQKTLQSQPQQSGFGFGTVRVFVIEQKKRIISNAYPKQKARLSET